MMRTRFDAVRQGGLASAKFIEELCSRKGGEGCLETNKISQVAELLLRLRLLLRLTERTGEILV